MPCTGVLHACTEVQCITSELVDLFFLPSAALLPQGRRRGTCHRQAPPARHALVPMPVRRGPPAASSFRSSAVQCSTAKTRKDQPSPCILVGPSKTRHWRMTTLVYTYVDHWLDAGRQHDLMQMSLAASAVIAAIPRFLLVSSVVTPES